MRTSRTFMGLIAAIGCLGIGLGQVQAQAINLNDYTLNFVDATRADAGSNAIGVSNPTSVDEWRLTIHSVIVFDRNDALNPVGFVPTTYTDYFAISVDSFVDKTAGTVVTPGYGNVAAGAGATPTHEVTIIGRASGTLLSLPPAGFAPMNLGPGVIDYNVIFDAATASDGTGYTLTNPGAPGDGGDWSTFSDGVVVERINDLTFGQVLLTAVAPPTVIDGSFDAKGPIVNNLSTLAVAPLDPDQSAFDEFELNYLDTAGDPIDLFGFDINHTVDGNFTLDTPDTVLFGPHGATGGDETRIDDFLMTLFGVDYDPTTHDAFGVRSDASINKEATIVPEPITAGLGSVALGVLAGYMSRRRRVA